MSLPIYLAVLFIASLVSFVSYGWDKRQARIRGQRIPEQTLHVVDVIGGWPGGLMAQQMFRHKNRKVRFQVVYWITVLAHLAVVGYSFWQGLIPV